MASCRPRTHSCAHRPSRVALTICIGLIVAVAACGRPPSGVEALPPPSGASLSVTITSRAVACLDETVGIGAPNFAVARDALATAVERLATTSPRQGFGLHVLAITQQQDGGTTAVSGSIAELGTRPADVTVVDTTAAVDDPFADPQTVDSPTSGVSELQNWNRQRQSAAESARQIATAIRQLPFGNAPTTDLRGCISRGRRLLGSDGTRTLLIISNFIDKDFTGPVPDFHGIRVIAIPLCSPATGNVAEYCRLALSGFTHGLRVAGASVEEQDPARMDLTVLVAGDNKGDGR